MKNDIQDHRSRLILGTAQLGAQYGIANKSGKPATHEALEIIRYAFLNGIDTFDTAPGYGDSETLIGKFINEQKKSGKKLPTIITKIPSLYPSSISPSYVDAIIETYMNESIKRLNIEKIDVCLLHQPNDMISYNGKVVASLIRLKNEGKIKKIGISIYTPEEVKTALSLDCFDVIQVPINILDHRLLNSGLLKELFSRDIEILGRSIYLQGLVFLDPDALPLHLQSAKRHLHNLRQLSRYLGLSLAELSMLFVREIPEINKIIMGCESIRQLKTNLKIMSLPKLSDGILQQIHLLFYDIPEKIINPTLWNQ